MILKSLITEEQFMCEFKAFISGTAAEIVPIQSFDDRVLGEPGPITKRIQASFFLAVQAKLEKFVAWNESV